MWKIYLNCGERWRNDWSSQLYTRLNHSCEIKTWKKTRPAWTGFEPMISVIPVQCFTNWATKATGCSSRCEFVIYPSKVKSASEYIKDHIFELRRMIWIHDWSSQIWTAWELTLMMSQKRSKPECVWKTYPKCLNYGEGKRHWKNETPLI